ncbi:MAG: ornithine--oxo-acid transaminase [Reichenbachiella sp.]|uniref:ornithine--oxo-acid transaminase n=1 Tax=Reichenbachiella sp. TaxID=2184521 RepID=UPI002967536F|nr:ornithine--oxo-acid transaminase [Reichenbachiella sp.]MDW3212039.1 ornithine--oxo-acid transaminase [Reichenbachiella sp.]
MELLLSKTEELIQQESDHSAHNYHPLPVVLSQGKGVFVTDVEGKQYFDFLSAYSAVNQGHCHPKIVAKIKEQSERLTLTSRAFHNDQFADYATYVTKLFGYDKLLPMNTGAEAVETAMKLARKWAYERKRVPENEAVILFASENFHGRTLAVVSASSDPESRGGFGPYMPGVRQVPYNDLKALEKALEDKNVAAFIVEPIQGEAGVVVPDDDYLAKAFELCCEQNALLVADEIQTGIGRTGKLLCSDHSGIKPHMVLLGKALSGGTVPVSAVLAPNEVMKVIKPGQHGSTYGGSPLGSAVAKTALQVVLQESMIHNADKMGKLFRARMEEIISKCSVVKAVRGKGLLNAIIINTPEDSDLAMRICIELMHNGLLAKPTHGNKIRLAPPLVITEEQMNHAMDILERTILKFNN